MEMRTETGKENKDGLKEDTVVKEVEGSQVSKIDLILAQGRRPFEIILKGGPPWGFALSGGRDLITPLHISKIVAGGRASESALAEGDYILGVNDVACADVGHTLDIVDAAVNTLRITVLRGHVNPTRGESLPSRLAYRSVDVEEKVSGAKHFNDDSVVYCKSRSQQRDGASMRPHKRRGDSFNRSVGPNFRQDKYTAGEPYPFDMYPSDVNSSRVNMYHSVPAHNLHRYQPDYENICLLGTAPIGSEKISEIDDIEEVTARDSIPHTPEVQDCDPLHGAGLPTRDPASLKYIKVNQNHEKYPSWPVTKPSGATEQTQPINSRAQSMTDHTNTSTEFPHKQQLAYTPGLRPLAEKNSPIAERKTDDNKARNSSDPGLKSEFVYGPYGRVERRNVGKPEGRFDEFYNSKPGYPPPNMDPDGHNLGDKEYNAPSPPERDSKGVDQINLS
ncbi:unnamed protein product, partial [Candidula unifasciata]